MEAAEQEGRGRAQIVAAALHVLHDRDRGLVLADLLLELNASLRDAIADCVTRTMQLETVGTARWSGDSTCRVVTSAMLAGKVSLLHGSRELAASLQQAAPRRTPSDLLVVQALDEATQEPFLAILRLDLRHGFRREIKDSSSGVSIRFSVVEDLLPLDRRLQRAAFIPLTPPESAYDLLFLDSQGPSGYFTERFLECEPIAGAREFTRRLPQETERWLQMENLPAPVALDVRETVIRAIDDPSVDIDNLAETIPGDSGLRERYRSYLQDSGFSSFRPDRAVADRMNAYLTYILDGGVRISGDPEAVSQLLRVDPDPTSDGKVRLVIESARFERKY